MVSTVKNSIEILGIANHLPKQPTIFKHFCIERNLILPEAMPNIAHLIRASAEINIIRTTIVKTPVITSLEGQNLTGMNLITIISLTRL